MLKYLKEYSSEFERDLNIPLMRKEADRPLVEYVLDSWKSLQIVEGIKFIDYTYTEKESINKALKLKFIFKNFLLAFSFLSFPYRQSTFQRIF